MGGEGGGGDGRETQLLLGFEPGTSALVFRGNLKIITRKTIGFTT